MNTNEIQITVDGKTRVVLRAHYITAKTKQLRDRLSEKEVAAQLDKIIAGDKALDVIGMFMENEVTTRK